MSSREELLTLAEAEYADLVGKTVLVKYICGWTAGGRETAEVFCDPPVPVRVLDTYNGPLDWDVYDWIDPTYDVEPLQPIAGLDPQRSHWIYGYSRSTSGEESPGSIVAVMTDPA